MRFPASFIDPEEGGILSLVGSGGKTSLMFALAAFLAGEGKRVLTTTTTRIRPPRSEQSPFSACSSDPLQWLRSRSGEALPRHVTLTADYDAHQNKLLGYCPETIDRIRESGPFNWILAEADGAAGRPLKAPGRSEPVPCAGSTHVIAVVGLDGIYRRLEADCVFRCREFAALSALSPGEPVTPEAACRVLVAREGLFRGTPDRAERIVFLNKAETVERLRAGRAMAGVLTSQGVRTVIGSIVQGWVSEQGTAAGATE